MSQTSNFKMDYLIAAQTQKHLTVNNALARMDALAQLVLIDDVATTPNAPIEGDCYGVGTGIGDFTGHDGKIAIYLNGGFEFVIPNTGWRAWVVSKNAHMVFDGMAWRTTSASMSVLDFEHTVSGAVSTTIQVIPEKTSVVGVTARVTTAILGAGVTDWKLGVAGADDRYGSGLWLGQNGWVKGLTGTPITYWADTPLILTANGGSFDGGVVRLQVYYHELPVPPEV